MADTLQVTIRGKDRLFQRLKTRLPETLQAELEAVNLASAEEMVRKAQDLAPWKTGGLVESIIATPAGKMTPSHSQPGGSVVVPPGAAMVTAGNADVRYAHLVEFGTKAHKNKGIFEGTDNPGTAARPFFWPAYRIIRSKMKSRASRALSKAIKASQT